MHIVYVPDSFPQPSETFVINEIDGLLNKGFHISVVPRIEGDKSNIQHARLQAILPKINVVYNKTGFDGKAFFYGLKYGTQVWLGWRPPNLVRHIKNALSIAGHVAAIKQQNPDLVLIHFGYDNAIAGAIAAKLLNRPSVLWLHGSDMYTVPHRSLHWLEGNISRIVTNSQYSADLLKVLGVNQAKVSYLGVDLDKFVPSKSSIKEQVPTVICVARLGHNKNHPRLLELFEQLITKVPDARLWLVGDGPNRQQYESLVSEKNKANIVFWGALSQEKIIELLNKAWLKALLSEKEGLGVAFIEAQATALPCVASNVGGIPEVVENNKTGFLFDLDDVDFDKKVSDAIVNLLTNHELRETMGKNARIRAMELFDENLHIERMEGLVNNLLGRE